MGQRDEESVRQYVEHLAMVMADFGFPRMEGRVLGALSVAEEGVMTARQLSEWLGVSPAAVSGAVRYLLQVGLVVREPVPGSRSVRYRSRIDTYYVESVARGGVYRKVAEAVGQGVDLVGADTQAGRRIADMVEFFLFMEEEIAALVAKWYARRDKS